MGLLNRRRFLKCAVVGAAVTGSALAGYEFDKWETSLTGPSGSTVTKTQTVSVASTVTESVTVYPPQELNVLTKGVCYWTNLAWFDNVDRANNDMDIIRDELGCNGIRIVTTLGSTNFAWGAEDDLVKCAEMAIAKGFDNITICPRYMDASLEETQASVKKFAVQAERLSRMSDAIVFQVGNELSVDASGICQSPTYEGRAAEMDKHSVPSSPDVKKYQQKLERLLRGLISVSRESYRGKLSYAAHPGEWGIPWDKLDFDIVGQNQYWWPECSGDQEFIDILKQRRTYGKPVHITEFGCATYDGAFELGGAAYRRSGVYNADAQARGIQHYLDLINEARIDGCFLWAFRDSYADSASSFSLVGGDHRKEAFYMYKSYQRIA